MGLLGSFGALLEAFWGDMGPFLDLLATIWAYPEPLLDLLAYRCGEVPPTRGCLLDPIWASAGGKVPPFLTSSDEGGPV